MRFDHSFISIAMKYISIIKDVLYYCVSTMTVSFIVIMDLVFSLRAVCICFAQSENLHNLENALCILRIPRLRNTCVQSGDCITCVRNLRTLPADAYQGKKIARAVAARSWDSKEVQRNLEVAQILRLHGTYIIYHLEKRFTTLENTIAALRT